jgi:surfeit locus 1 family protein
MRAPEVPAAARRRRRYRFEFWPAAFAVAGLALLVSLGTWQLQRLVWKRNLIARAEAQMMAPPEPLPPEPVEYQDLDFRRTVARGTYRHADAFGFGLSAVAGRQGGRVVTPLALYERRTLLVDRGWVPAELLPPNLPDGLEPEGEVEVRGVARYRGGEVARGPFRPDDDPAARRWYAWDMARMAEALGAPLLPVVLTAESVSAAGPGELPRAEPVRVDLDNNHLGYAITWYGLAVVLAGTYLAFSTRDPTAHGPPA